MNMIQKLVKRVGKLNSNQVVHQPSPVPKAPVSGEDPEKRSNPVVCRRCRQEGHYQ